jgi:hypothetical protein
MAAKQGYSPEQDSGEEQRQAEHIIESEQARGKSEAEAKRIAYGTIRKRAKNS